MTSAGRRPSRIEDYALIGDCQSAALVSREGSMDWLCLPRFDSGACFSALLGDRDNGSWLLRPRGEARVTARRYLTDTLVLQTDWECASGVVRVTDFMPVRTQQPDVVRVVEGVRGRVPVEMELVPRFDYGWIEPWIRLDDGGHEAIAVAGPDSLHLRSAMPLERRGTVVESAFEVRGGERAAFVMHWCPTFEPAQAPRDPDALLDGTVGWWREWCGRCTFDGPWRDAVMRSLITLKALTHAPTGGIVAAATTSLPELIGGERNWDYRYCWLRDATFTLHALMVGGYFEEARAWREWLVNVVAGTPDKIQMMYGVAGERRLTELELDWLPGYEGSTPVRTGNAAYLQNQLDVYGEVMDAMHLARCAGLPPSEDAWRVQKHLVSFVENAWHEPDNGIWEVRGPARHFTHSKLMAWVALDRAVQSVERFHLDGHLDRWRRVREEIRTDILAHGYDAELGAFTQAYGMPAADASLLMVPLVGFLPPEDPRVVGTVRLVERRLVEDGLVHRYRPEHAVEGVHGAEGAFLLCTFWLADNLALQGRVDEASALFERLLALRNDVGLLAEEYDPSSRRLLGNFPQAFSHIGLINTAWNLSQRDHPRSSPRECGGLKDPAP